MIKFLLGLETVLVFPFFLLSWLLCSIAFAIRSGFDLAQADGDSKEDVLKAVFGKKEKETKE